MEVRRTSPEEADGATGYAYTDVRTTEEFEAGHVPGAKNIPVFERGSGRMHPRFVEVVEASFPRNARLITGRQKGARSLRAVERLIKLDSPGVVDRRGGFGGETDPLGQVTYPGWEPRGFPVSTESAPDDRCQNLAKK